LEIFSEYQHLERFKIAKQAIWARFLYNHAMAYYEVWAAGQRFHGKAPLTYSSEEPLVKGTVVRIPMQNDIVTGVVERKVTKPAFKTKGVVSVFHDKPIPLELLELFHWLRAYYPAPAGLILSLFLPGAMVKKPAEFPMFTGLSEDHEQKLPPLTQEQTNALSIIESAFKPTALLHGDTGTGKTRVYVELVRKALEKNTSAIILTPEIGLTPQLIGTLEATFPGKVLTTHSHLTPSERRKIWLKVHASKEPLIVIGPRSALFAPLKKIGIIIIDEFHDQAYKQEQAPYYQTSRVAAKLATLHNAKLILGSATPPIADYWTLKSKQLPIIRMTELAVNAPSRASTKVVIIDANQQHNFSRSPWLSDNLLANISKTLTDKQQVLIFLNRRGSARLVLCKECGWQATCDRCDLPLTYHGDSHRLTCHTCGFSSATPSSCPECKAADIIFRSPGTKTLVSEIEKIFPKARIMRFDSDSLKPDRLEQHYEAIKRGDIDILVGTQMLAKGLDLPKLSLVGIAAADTSLYFPDFTAEERTFQLMSQVMGRVGRGHTEGKIVVQTYQPESPAIINAVEKQYEQFYEYQIRQREQFSLPPFTYILKLTCSRASRKAAQTASTKLVDSLSSNNTGVEIIGPSPAFQEKMNNKYRWQLVVKAKQREKLTKIIASLPANWTYDLDPAHLL
jgi:primosomal protein N' (replication factor Y) (superfamily II helicase)